MSILSGFTDSFGQLLAVRGLQGLGFGGEWAVGSVLMGDGLGYGGHLLHRVLFGAASAIAWRGPQ